MPEEQAQPSQVEPDSSSAPSPESELLGRQPASRVARRLLDRRQSPSDEPAERSPQPASTASAQPQGQPLTAFSSDDLPEEKPQPQPRARMPKATGLRLRRLMDEDLGDELEEALAGFSEETVMAEQPRMPAVSATGKEDPGKAEKRTVRVLSVHRDSVFVDLGEKSDGVVSIQQFEKGPPKAGDLIQVIIDQYDPTTGQYRLRVPGAVQEVDWKSVEKGTVVSAVVRKVNKGGLEVTVNGLRGFMPAGQVDLDHIADLSGFVGQSLKAVVQEVNPAARNLVVSRRAILEQERAERARQTLAELEPGQIRQGIVKRVLDFGAFVDIGGVEGLVPVREMSWMRVKHPSEVLSEGQEVRVQVLRFDADSKKITLGLKQLAENPWTRAGMTYQSGETITGTVTRIAEFGAFVQLEPAIEGLVHISELATHRVRRVEEVVQPGQTVNVKILECDPVNQRISLSIKRALPEPEPEPTSESEAAAALEPVAAPKPKRIAPLKGGLGGGGPLFG